MIKKALVYTIATIILFSFGFMLSELEPFFKQKVSKIMTVEEFLYENNPNHWNELYLNKDGNVEYKNMVIVKDNDHKPINDKTAYTNTELILYFRAEGIRPEEWGCDQSDIAKTALLVVTCLLQTKNPVKLNLPMLVSGFRLV